MRSTLKMTILTAALVGISLTGLQLTNAQEVTFDMGNVSVAFADGYMDRNNQFHQWEHRTDSEQYRAKHTDQYRAWRHDDPRHRGEEDNRR
jgi:hypothetical protein